MDYKWTLSCTRFVQSSLRYRSFLNHIDKRVVFLLLDWAKGVFELFSCWRHSSFLFFSFFFLQICSWDFFNWLVLSMMRLFICQERSGAFTFLVDLNSLIYILVFFVFNFFGVLFANQATAASVLLMQVSNWKDVSLESVVLLVWNLVLRKVPL